MQPNNGNQVFQMAEAGVPEMALPLTSTAVEPFADAIASRISGGSVSNNSTVNFNSTFSLTNDSQLRSAARKLQPYLVAEQKRTGA